MNEPKPIATFIKQLLTPTTWCQQDYAVDVDGNRTSPNSPTACKFCILGAFEKVTKEVYDTFPSVHRILLHDAVADITKDGFKAVSVYNDQANSFEAISTLLDKYEELETAYFKSTEESNEINSKTA